MARINPHIHFNGNAEEKLYSNLRNQIIALHLQSPSCTIKRSELN
jgi:hypothetical protein